MRSRDRRSSRGLGNTGLPRGLGTAGPPKGLGTTGPSRGLGTTGPQRGSRAEPSKVFGLHGQVPELVLQEV